MVDGGEVVGEFVVDDAEGGEVGGVDVAAGVVRFALVALGGGCKRELRWRDGG